MGTKCTCTSLSSPLSYQPWYVSAKLQHIKLPKGGQIRLAAYKLSVRCGNSRGHLLKMLQICPMYCGSISLEQIRAPVTIRKLASRAFQRAILRVIWWRVAPMVAMRKMLLMLRCSALFTTASTPCQLSRLVLRKYNIWYKAADFTRSLLTQRYVYAMRSLWLHWLRPPLQRETIMYNHAKLIMYHCNCPRIIGTRLPL